MINKHKFYHGAAIVRLLEDERCKALRKKGSLGYICNEKVFLFVKYTTKARTPWQFTFDQEDVDRANRMAAEYGRAVCVFVCGGDGVCAVSWEEVQQVINNTAGRVAVARKHNKQHSVWGGADQLEHKVAINQWPAVVFETSPEVATVPMAAGVQ